MQEINREMGRKVTEEEARLYRDLGTAWGKGEGDIWAEVWGDKCQNLVTVFKKKHLKVWYILKTASFAFSLSREIFGRGFKSLIIPNPRKNADKGLPWWSSG